MVNIQKRILRANYIDKYFLILEIKKKFSRN